MEVTEKQRTEIVAKLAAANSAHAAPKTPKQGIAESAKTGPVHPAVLSAQKAQERNAQRLAAIAERVYARLSAAHASNGAADTAASKVATPRTLEADRGRLESIARRMNITSAYD